jgi:hypothetical protein
MTKNVVVENKTSVEIEHEKVFFSNFALVLKNKYSKKDF